MKVVILKTGEIKEVADGYARNYLLPNKLAVPANSQTIAQAEAKQKALAAQAEAQKAQEAQAFKAIQGAELNIKAKANEEGKLFAALQAADIKQALTEQLKVNLPENYFKLKEPIKNLGEVDVEVVSTAQVKAKLHLKITNKE